MEEVAFCTVVPVINVACSKYKYIVESLHSQTNTQSHWSSGRGTAVHAPGGAPTLLELGSPVSIVSLHW